MPLILIADDDRALVDVLKLALARYDTVDASDGASILHQIQTEQPALVLLNLGLPDVDGGVLLSRIRRSSQVPVVIISGRHEQVDKVLSLQAGADDFVEKPFDIDDLEARIEAVLRRSERLPMPIVDGLRMGALSIGPKGRGVRIDGEVFLVPPTGYKLLELLVTGETVSRENASQAVWGFSDASTGHVVDVQISRLRARLRQVPNAPTIVTMRRRAGFQMVPES